MMFPKASKSTALLGLTLLASMAALVGCSKKDGETDTSGGGAGGGTTATASAGGGQGVFQSKCAGCHGANGAGGKAPNLTQVAADPTHTPQWLAEYIKNPKSKNPNSRMPGFEGRISDADIQSVVAYLGSLK